MPSSFPFDSSRRMTTPLDDALSLFGYLSLDELNEQTLKKDFKRLAVKAHPDHGGDAMDFDCLLSGFVFLSSVLRRQTGGRDKASVLHPSDVQQARDEQFSSEMAILVNEVLDGIQREEQSEFCRVFNAQYEEYKAKEDGKGFSSSESRGYSDWLASEEKSCVSFLPDGEYGPFTMAPPLMKQDDLHVLFEQSARCGKKVPITDLALLPMDMAIPSSSLGSMILPSSTEPFTSGLQEKPRYVDIYDAFTTHTTTIDKLPLYEESTRTFEDLLKERDIEYKTEHDKDLEAIAMYERIYQQQQEEHKKRIQQFFESTGSSQWALPSASRPSVDEEKTFFITLGS